MLALISFKIHERFKNLLSAFRYFDNDHQLSLTLNEFAQGIEHLRIKISFDQVKQIFNFLDKDMDGQISFEEFKQLSEENWRKFDPIKQYIQNLSERKRKDENARLQSQDDTVSKLSKVSIAGLERLAFERKIQMMKTGSRNKSQNQSGAKNNSTHTSGWQSVSKSCAFMKPNQVDPSELTKKLNGSSLDISHGLPLKRGDNMTDIMQNNFLRQSIVNKINRADYEMVSGAVPTAIEINKGLISKASSMLKTKNHKSLLGLRGNPNAQKRLRLENMNIYGNQDRKEIIELLNKRKLVA